MRFGPKSNREIQLFDCLESKLSGALIVSFFHQSNYVELFYRLGGGICYMSGGPVWCIWTQCSHLYGYSRVYIAYHHLWWWRRTIVQTVDDMEHHA